MKRFCRCIWNREFTIFRMTKWSEQNDADDNGHRVEMAKVMWIRIFMSYICHTLGRRTVPSHYIIIIAHGGGSDRFKHQAENVRCVHRLKKQRSTRKSRKETYQVIRIQTFSPILVCSLWVCCFKHWRDGEQVICLRPTVGLRAIRFDIYRPLRLDDIDSFVHSSAQLYAGE